MKLLLFIPLWLLSAFQIHGQTHDSIDTTHILKDTNGVQQLARAARMAAFINPDEGKRIAKKAVALAIKIGYKKGEAEALNWYGEACGLSGDYPTSLKVLFEALQIYRALKDSFDICSIMGEIAWNYDQLQQYRQALAYLEPASHFFERAKGPYRGSFEFAILAEVYIALKRSDSAFYYGHKAFELFTDDPSTPHLKQFILRSIGDIYAQGGKTDSALLYYRWSVFTSDQMKDKLNTTKTQVQVAHLYEAVHEYDSALWYAKTAFDNAQSVLAKSNKLEATELLVILYQQKQKKDSALFYLTIAYATKDSLYGPEKVRQLQLLALDEQQKQQAVLQQQEQYKNHIKYIALLSVIAVFLLLSFILYRSNKHKQQTNTLLQEQKQKVESTLSELKTTQAQLIQSEKMASLGELTAGIAHEIQNPLNFVNNFSETNKELIQEAKEEFKSGKYDDGFTLLNAIQENEGKIAYHGSRADAIVKNMLEHSRTSKGERQPTYLNSLIDEYLRLAYHGFRAKNKNFNATIETHFDESIGKINIVPQEIGRVLLNLFNNAFYAVREKKKTADDTYEPTVTVTSKKANDKIEISVKDNGTGIAQQVSDKIFQPFFTTKPTGEGTGLGLSLSYDIIKAHGGELHVESTEGEGSVLTIILPIG